MAQTVNFNGVTLRIPGAYSSLSVKQTGASPLAETGIVGIIGESLKGPPGISEGIQEFDSSTLADLIELYGSGEIVKAAKALVNASNDARVTNGANRILVYKTNQSTKASATIASAWGTMTSNNWGSEENLINYRIDEDTAEAWLLEFAADHNATPSDLTLRINGEATVTLTGANCDSAANTVTEINTKFNTALGTVAINYASSVGDRISIDLLATGSGASRDGMGICLEFDEDAEYDKIGVSSAQRGKAISTGSDATSITAADAKRSFVVNRQSDGLTEDSDTNTGEIGGDIHMEIGCNAATTCTLTINATNLIADATGAGASDLNLTLSDYETIADLAEFIDSQTGYSCSIPANINSGLSPTVLDRVTAVGICATKTGIKPGKVKADSYSVRNYFDRNSALVVVTETTYLGLPDVTAKTFLSGGTRGATTTSDVNDGLVAFESIRINELVTLFSQDASDDIVEDADHTDPSSTYDIESIHVATRNHCKNMSNTQNKSERNCYVGYRGTFEECKTQSKTIASEFASIVIQDAQILNSVGELEWAQPHIAACLIAGIQAGTEVGEPATYKFISANGIRHLKKQGVTPLSTEDFDSSLIGHKNQAIDNGITPIEAPSSGGIRCVVHNTTYQKDGSYVFNRVHVLEAANYVAYDLRKYLEDIYTGTKAKTGSAESIRNSTIARMMVYLAADIIVGDDTNNQLGYKNLVVTVTGNTAIIDIIITPVQGIDFILARIELDNIRQTA